jgi:hypothetical protein
MLFKRREQCRNNTDSRVNVSCDMGISSSYQSLQITLSTDIAGYASSASTTLLNIGDIKFLNIN